MGHTIIVYSHKGGTSKTTTTANLCEALGRSGKSVLAIDLDAQGNLTSLLLPVGSRTQKTLTNLLEDALDRMDKRKPHPLDVRQYSYASTVSGTFIIPNNSDTTLVEPQFISKAPRSFAILKEILAEEKEKYDFVIIDCPPNLGVFVITALLAADIVIAPIDAGGTFGIESFEKSLMAIKAIEDENKSKIGHVKILITKADRRTTITKSNATLVRKLYPGLVFETEIPFNTDIQKSEAAKQTVFAFKRSSNGAKAYNDLGKELMSLLSETKQGKLANF